MTGQSKRRTACLNLEEQDALREKMLAGQPDDVLSDEFLITAKVVAEYRQHFGIAPVRPKTSRQKKKKRQTKKRIETPEPTKQTASPTESLPADAIVPAHTTRGDLSGDDRVKFAQWVKKFKTSNRYKKIAKMLATEDLEFFVEQWAIYHLQIDDMTAAEEDSLENMIIVKIRIDENQRAMRFCKMQEDQIRRNLGIDDNGEGAELDLENDQDRMLLDLVVNMNRRQTELNKELKELLSQYDVLQKSLNQTRAQREANQKIGGDTFLTLIRSFNDRDRRKIAGTYNERMRKATENHAKKMKQPQKFLDGSTSPILLDGDDFKK